MKHIPNIFLGLSLAVAGCSNSLPPAADEAEDQHQALASPDNNVTGRWRITLIDGEPPASSRSSEVNAYLAITDYSISGMVGCNEFSAPALIAGGRIAVFNWMSTKLACPGQSADQEMVLGRIFFDRPKISRLDAKRARISSPGHSISLDWEGKNASSENLRPPQDLNGTKWQIMSVNGLVSVGGLDQLTLSFTNDGWMGTAACASFFGQWKAENGKILTGPDTSMTEQNCPSDLAAIDTVFAELMRSNPSYFIGPTDELFIAGTGHALAAQRKP